MAPNGLNVNVWCVRISMIKLMEFIEKQILKVKLHLGYFKLAFINCLIEWFINLCSTANYIYISIAILWQDKYIILQMKTNLVDQFHPSHQDNLKTQTSR